MFQRPFIIGKFSSNSSSVQDTYPHLIRGETEAFYFLNINLLFFFFFPTWTWYKCLLLFSKDRIPWPCQNSFRPLFKKILQANKGRRHPETQASLGIREGHWPRKLIGSPELGPPPPDLLALPCLLTQQTFETWPIRVWTQIISQRSDLKGDYSPLQIFHPSPFT